MTPKKPDADRKLIIAVSGGGHTWPGGLQYLPESVIRKTSREFNASDVIWQFFKAPPME